MMSRKVFFKNFWWTLPAAILAFAVAILLYSTFAGYQPFKLKSYVVKPSVVCTDGKVTAQVTRKFTKEFNTLVLNETWITEQVPGVPPNRPVQSNQGILPDSATKEMEHFTTTESPLLIYAPSKPGKYVVRIIVEAHGLRWGIVPAVGRHTYYSNVVTVKDC